jgi:zinc protease
MKGRLAAIGAAVLGALTLGLTAAAIEAPPAPGTPQKVTIPAKTRFALDNGLVATLVPFGEVPKVAVLARVRTGNLNEGGRTWLADLATDLLKEGTENYDARQLAEAAARMGGALSIGVGSETTTVSIDVLTEFGPDAVALVAEVLRRPTFPESELPRIKQDFLRGLAVSRSQPQALGSEAFNALLYPDHPFGTIFPTEDELASYTIDDVRGYYAENFGARRTRVYVGGVFDEPVMETAIRDAFGDWAEGPEVFIDVPAPVADAQGRFVDRPDAVQSNIILGLPVADPSSDDYTRLQFTNSLFGAAGFLSRLVQNIREEKGYAYSPGSGMSSHYRDTIWQASANVDTPSTGPALTEIFAELRRLQDEPPSDREMELIRNYRTGVFTLANASRGGVLGTIAFMDFHGLPDSWLEDYVPRFRAVTAEEVQETAKEYLRLDEMTLVVVGDGEQVREQLREVPEASRMEGL